VARILSASLVVVATLLVGSSAAAQTEIQAPDEVVYDKVTKFDFSEVELQGAIDRAGGTILMVAPRASFASMIPVRGNFLAELQESAEAL